VADPIDIGDDWEAEPVEHDPFASAPAATQPQGLGAIASSGGIGSDAVASGTASTPAPPPLDPHDRDQMIRTIAGEAGGEPEEGQAALAHVIFNRRAAGGYGDSIADIVKAPAQGTSPNSGYHEFTTWNPPNKHGNTIAQNLDPKDPQYTKLGAIVDMAHSGEYPDLTGGATHYYAPRGMPGGKPPAQWPQDWFNAAPKAKIGNQIFVGGSGGPGQKTPTTQVTGGPQDEGIASS
jgi:conjugal transfer mating pair stabilization protein TraG